MLFPRFSIRWLLLATTVIAVLSLVGSIALDGRPWAIGLAAFFGSAVALFILFAATFLISQWFALLMRLVRPAETGSSPFADAGRPAQIIPPQEPE